jgi:hypothetical protein
VGVLALVRGGSERITASKAEIGVSTTFERAKTTLVRVVLAGEGAKLTAPLYLGSN